MKSQLSTGRLRWRGATRMDYPQGFVRGNDDVIALVSMGRLLWRLSGVRKGCPIAAVLFSLQLRRVEQIS
jgi:hypothetical protein